MEKVKKTTENENKVTIVDVVLLGCAAFLIAFTVVMIAIFCVYQTEPSTLITSVFSLLGGEITLSFAISKLTERKWEKDVE